MQEQIRTYMNSHRKQMVEDVKTLVRINSEKMEAKEGKPYGDGPAEALAEASRMLEGYGFPVKNYDNYVITTDLTDLEAGLDILAHLDVVPAGEGWTVTKPFEPVVQEGKIFGRGTSDDKGPAIAALYAMRAVKELGIPLKKNVRLILGSDEECGSSDIAHYFAIEKSAPMTFSPDADFPLIFLEKGSMHGEFSAKTEKQSELPKVIQIHSGIKINVVPAKAEAVVEGFSMETLSEYADNYLRKNRKVTIELNIQKNDGISILLKGKSAHASSPQDGENALTALLEFLMTLPLAKTANTALLESVNRLFPHGDYSGTALGVAREDEVSGKLTLTLDLFDFTEEEMSGAFDCRACVSANSENTRDVVYAQFEKAGFQYKKNEMNPPHCVEKDSDFVNTLLACYTKVTGKTGEPLAIGGGTYVHHIENGVAFGCADTEVDNHMHGPDEFMVIDQLVKSAEIFALAIIELCGA